MNNTDNTIMRVGYSRYENDYSNSPLDLDRAGIPPKKQKQKPNWKVYLSIILVTSIVNSAFVGGILYNKFSSEFGTLTASMKNTANASITGSNGADVTPVSGLTKTSVQAKEYSVVDIVKMVGPSIVGIRVTTSSPQNSLFGTGLSQSPVEGSGIIISKDGYILTNYHVVEGADVRNSAGSNSTLEVFLSDKRQVKAKFIGGDSKNDLAVIKVDLQNLPAAEFGDSSKLQTGELAIAIGNPLGMEFAGSVTVGVISAVNREVVTDDKTLNLIQTDAAINPGNSGGALVNSLGQVIGINTIKISEAGIEGLGFAIPINDAKPIIDQLVTYGYVKGRPFIGISGQEITQVLSQRYNLPVGIFIASVTSGSGADNAGIRKGDVLVSLAGKDVKTLADLENIKKNYKAGDTVNAVVVTNGVTRILKLTFTEEH